MLGVEHSHRDIVEVTSAAVHFPGFGVGHTPKLDLAVVTTGDDERKGRMERSPVDTSVVTLQDILDYCIGVTKQVSLTLTGTSDLFFGRHGSLRSLVFLAKTGDVPHTNGKVHRGGDDEIVPRVKLCAHNVVVVTGKDSNTSPRLPVPNSDSLVVGGRDDPRVFAMEENGSDIVEIYHSSTSHPQNCSSHLRPVRVKRHFLCL